MSVVVPCLVVVVAVGRVLGVGPRLHRLLRMERPVHDGRHGPSRRERGE